MVAVHQPDGNADVYDFENFRQFGGLWMLNRTVFHPRGFALAFVYGTKREVPIGWTLQGDGTEPWCFGDDAVEHRAFQSFEELLDIYRKR